MRAAVCYTGLSVNFVTWSDGDEAEMAIHAWVVHVEVKARSIATVARPKLGLGMAPVGIDFDSLPATKRLYQRLLTSPTPDESDWLTLVRRGLPSRHHGSVR
jgi:hypothetical protein